MKKQKKMEKNRNYLPVKALKSLKDYCDLDEKNTQLWVVPDPNICGVYAIQLQRAGTPHPIHLLWDGQYIEECDFEVFPPVVGDVAFYH